MSETKSPIIESFETSRNHVIRIGRYEPSGTSKGVILMLHGFGEHIQRYDGLAEFLTEKNYTFVIHDQRGFGAMPHMDEKQRLKKRGVVSDYDLFLDDIEFVRDKIKSWYPDTPLYLWGHSMGGNIALNFILKRDAQDFEKVILETPWLRLYEPKPAFLVALSRLTGKFSENLRISSNLPLKNISGADGFGKVLEDDPIYHDMISLRLFAQITDAGEYAMANASKIKLPVLLLCAENDRIVCSKAIKEFAGNCPPNVRLENIAGGAHSLHNDKEETKQKAMNIILDFCNG